MGCYTVPTAAAIVCFYMRKKNPSFNTKHAKWLNFMFAGGSIFGIVDHIWNGDLLAFSWSDMALGVVITASLFVSWMIMVHYDKLAQKSTTSS